MSKLIEITTEHVIPFKTLIEGLKDILNDVNIEIRAPGKKKKKRNKTTSSSSDEDSENSDSQEEVEEKGGIRISTTDSTNTLLINVSLDAKEFSTFICKKKVVDLGITLGQFHKLIKSLDKDDTLSMYVNEDDKQNLVLQVANPEKNYETTYKLKLMEINKTEYNIPSTAFDSIIVFDTAEFHRICREMSQIAEYIEIKCTKKTITYSCKGDCSERSTTYYTDDNGVKIKFSKNAPEIVQGIFELKNLVLFSKYSNLCSNIQIYMKNNYPLCIKYTVATLGSMLFCLTPIVDDNIMDNFSDEDDDYDEAEIEYKD